MAGQHDQKTHGHWAMSAGLQSPAPTKGRPKKNPIDGPDGTEFTQLPEELRARMAEIVSEAYPSLGDDPLSSIRDNVLSAYDAASDGIRAYGERWYGDAHNHAEQMAASTGYTVEQCAAAISAMSPQTGWESNVTMAHYVTQQLHDDVPFTQDYLDSPVTKSVKMPDGKTRSVTKTLSEWNADSGVVVEAGQRYSDLSDNDAATMLRNAAQRDSDKVLRVPRYTVTGEQTDESYGNGPPLTPGIRYAVNILRATDIPTAITENLNGHKTRSFYNNIITSSGTNCVTIDAHALDAAILGYASTHSGNKAKRVYGVDPAIVLDSKAKGLTSPEYGSIGTYALFAEGFREATRIVNAERAKEGKEPLTPAQVQAIVWIATLPPKGRQ